MKQVLERTFAADGPFAGHIPGFRLRTEQVEMSQAIGEAIESTGVLVAEAGTGRRTSISVMWTSSPSAARRLRFEEMSLAVGAPVNLEPALRAGDALGGHLVSGHVDGLGTVVSQSTDARSTRLVIEAPAELARFIARKGSVAVDGVSLTVNEVAGARFGVNLIPHTRDVTTLRNLSAGAAVNLEIDQVARYVERLLAPA